MYGHGQDFETLTHKGGGPASVSDGTLPRSVVLLTFCGSSGTEGPASDASNMFFTVIFGQDSGESTYSNSKFSIYNASLM